MPDQINQMRLNSEDPAASYDSLSMAFYRNLATKTGGALPEFETLRDRNKNVFHNIMLDDQSDFHNLEDQPDYKAAIDPSRIADANSRLVIIKNNKNALKNPNLTPDETAILQQQINNAQREYVQLQLRQIDAVLEQFVALQQEALRKLKAQQAIELRDFNAQLDAYVAQFPADQQAAKQDIADKQKDAFLAYQQQQLNHLKTLYEERQENFLTRIQDAERDLYLLYSNGKTPQEAREALVQPSTYGNGVSSEKSSAIKRDYYSIPCGPKAEDRIQYSITLQGEGSQVTGNVHFDSNQFEIPYQYHVAAFNTMFSKLLAEGKNHIDLMQLKRSFPINERYQATLAMAKHIWAINPDATIEPGELPGKDPIPGGRNHTGYYRDFINLRADVEAKRALMADRRARNGFPPQQPEPEAKIFDIGQPLVRPGNVVQPVENLLQNGRAIELGPLPDPLLANANNGEGNQNNNRNGVGAENIQFRPRGLRGGG